MCEVSGPWVADVAASSARGRGSLRCGLGGEWMVQGRQYELEKREVG